MNFQDMTGCMTNYSRDYSKVGQPHLIHLLMFGFLCCARKPKRPGYRFKKEAAKTAALIDDAAQAVEITAGSIKQHAQDAANLHF
jgi:hypothetical protein